MSRAASLLEESSAQQDASSKVIFLQGLGLGMHDASTLDFGKVGECSKARSLHCCLMCWCIIRQRGSHSSSTSSRGKNLCASVAFATKCLCMPASAQPQTHEPAHHVCVHRSYCHLIRLCQSRAPKQLHTAGYAVIFCMNKSSHAG